MAPTPLTTVVILHYLDGTPDRDFHLRGLLRGEPLHQRLDALLAELERVVEKTPYGR